MAARDSSRRGRKGPPADPLASLLATCAGIDPENIVPSGSEEIFESGGESWLTMVSVCRGGDSPLALLLFRAAEAEACAETLLTRLGQAFGEEGGLLLRRLPAEDWRLELERRRSGALRCRKDRGGSAAILVDEGLASALAVAPAVPATPTVQAPPVSGQAGRSRNAEPPVLRLEHPALLPLPALFLPREWTAGQAHAALSWTGLFAPPPSSGENTLRWTAAWTAGEAKMGFHLEVRPPRGADAEAVARAVQPLLAAGWRAAWPRLALVLPGISAPAFGRNPSLAGKAELAVTGRLLAGAATLELSLLLPAGLLRLFPAPGLGGTSGGSGGTEGRAAPISPIALFLAVNDGLLKASLLSRPRSGAPAPEKETRVPGKKPPAAAKEEGVKLVLDDGDDDIPLPGQAAASKPESPGEVAGSTTGLPALPSLLSLFAEADLARLVQSYFLPEYGVLGFQALFFGHKAGEKGTGGATLPVLPFDERRILAALPQAGREEWAEARRAGLPRVKAGREDALAAGAEALEGLWEAHRKKRFELGHGGKTVLTEWLGERIEAADRSRLEELVERDLPLSLLEGLDRQPARTPQSQRVRVRRVLDRLSAKELALATWGRDEKRPLMDASISRGKKAEAKAEAAILARRLATGEEAAGTVVEAREELVAKVKDLLEGLTAE